MATIVQPYNPWREQLALTALGNIAGDIIGDMWKTHRQNEQNKKINAFRGELQNLAQQQQGNISLAQPQAPQGYNSNPWASALHQSYSPLTQFDIGTAGIGKTPSLQDIARNADTLAASKRFSMLSPETVQGVKNSMMQNAIASLFGNASDIEGRMNALTMGAANGVVAPQVLTAFSPWARDVYSPYTFHESDLGQNKVVTALNAHTGQANTALSMPVTVSPNEAARNAASIQAANINANAHIFGSKSAAEMKKQELQLEQYKQAIADYDSQLKGIDDDITAHLAVMDTLPTDEARAAYRLSKIAHLEEDKARITAERNEAQARYRNALGFGTGAGTTQNSNNLGDLSYWGETSNGIGKDNNGKPFDYSTLINKYAKQFGIDPDFAAAVMQWESGGNPNALSPQGAVGLFQLMPKTAKALGVNPHNIEENIKGGIMYLAQLRDKYNGNHELILRGYNAGPGATDAGRYPQETRKYVPGVLSIYRKYRERRPQAPAQSQNTPNVTAISNLQPQPQNTTQQVQGSNSQVANQDRTIFYNDKEDVFITQSELDEIIAEGAKEGLGPLGVKARLRQKGFKDLPENKNVTQVSPALNWSPSYMGNIPQGEALTAPDTSRLPVPQTDNTTQNEQTPTVSDDSRNTPIFTRNFADMISDAVSGWGLTQGDNTIPDSKNIPNANPILDFLLKNYRNYPHLPFQNWPIGSAYNPQPSAFPDNYSDKNRRNITPHFNSGNPVYSRDNPWSYVQEQNYYPFWRLAEWIDNGALNDNDISPQYPLSSPSTLSNYNNAAAKVLWDLIYRKR